MADNKHVLEIEARRGEGGLLHGPTRERMSDRVGETRLSEVHIDLRTSAGVSVFEGSGRNIGLEAHGDLRRLLAMQT